MINSIKLFAFPDSVKEFQDLIRVTYYEKKKLVYKDVLMYCMQRLYYL